MIWDPVERLPREALRELQLERLRATFQLDVESLDDVAELPFTDQVRVARGLPVRAAARAGGVARAAARVERNARHAHGRRLHARRPRCVDRADGPLHDDGRRPARDAHPQREHVRPVHRRPRLPPGCGADRRAGAAGVRRLHHAAGDAAAGARRAGADRDAVVRARDRADRARRRGRPDASEARARAVRRRGLDRGTARGDRARAARHPRGQLLRPVGDVRARRRRGVPGGPRRAARARGSLPRRGDRSRHRRSGRAKASRGSSCSRRC